MAKFKGTVTETVYHRFEEVEADNIDEARNQIYEIWAEGKMTASGGDTEIEMLHEENE